MFIQEKTKEDILYAGQVIKKMVFKASTQGVSNSEYDLMIANAKYISDQLEINKNKKKN